MTIFGLMIGLLALWFGIWILKDTFRSKNEMFGGVVMGLIVSVIGSLIVYVALLYAVNH